MNKSNYTRSITVGSSPRKVFSALTKDIDKWWTRPDRALVNIGDRAKFSFPPSNTFWTFEATVLERDRRVSMLCVDAHHVHEGMPTEIEKEWIGTSVKWTILPSANGTTIRIEHVGLVPKLKCYQVCVAGWDIFFVESLQSYLDTGTGSPHQID